MDATEKKSLSEEVMRLARRIRRHSHGKGHFGRLDRLRVLLLANEGISLRDLAGLMDMRPPSVSEWLDQLLLNREIEKAQGAEDRRMVQIFLTEKGKELALAAKERAKGFVDILAGCLSSEEEEVFSDTCKRLYRHLEAQGSSRRQGRRQGAGDERGD